MGRIRTIKPELHKHEDLSMLPPETHMLAIALLNYADDEGYFNANVKLVKAECCPLREDSMSVHGSLKELSNIGFVRLGEGSNGRQYGHIVNFRKHQTISRPTESKIKSESITWHDSVSTHGVLREDSTPEQGTGNREQGTGNKNRKTTAADRKSKPSTVADSLSDPTDPDPIPTKRGRKLTGERKRLFQRFWETFALKKGRAEAADAWLDIAELDAELATRIITAAATEAANRTGESANGKSPKWAQGWLTGRRWEDEGDATGAQDEQDRLEAKQYGTDAGRQGFAAGGRSANGPATADANQRSRSRRT